MAKQRKRKGRKQSMSSDEAFSSGAPDSKAPSTDNHQSKKKAALRLIVSGANIDCSLIPEEISLDKDHMILGRSKLCDILIVALNPGGSVNNTISRKHISIDKDKDGIYEFKDLGTPNGTFLNGKKTTSGVLAHGDIIQLGGGAGLKDGEVLTSRQLGISFTFVLSDQDDNISLETRNSEKRSLSTSNSDANNDNTTNSLLETTIHASKKVKQNVTSYTMDLNTFTSNAMRKCKNNIELQFVMKALYPIIEEAIEVGDVLTRDWSQIAFPLIKGKVMSMESKNENKNILLTSKPGHLTSDSISKKVKQNDIQKVAVKEIDNLKEPLSSTPWTSLNTHTSAVLDRKIVGDRNVNKHHEMRHVSLNNKSKNITTTPVVKHVNNLSVSSLVAPSVDLIERPRVPVSFPPQPTFSAFSARPQPPPYSIPPPSYAPSQPQQPIYPYMQPVQQYSTNIPKPPLPRGPRPPNYYYPPPPTPPTPPTPPNYHYPPPPPPTHKRQYD